MRIHDWIGRKSKELKSWITAISIASRNPNLGFLPKILAFLTLAYAFSPIDLIPDFIPILGLLDDLLILPLLIFLTVKSIPDDVLREARIASVNEQASGKRRWALVPVIIAVWASIAFLGARAVFLRMHEG